MELTKLSKLLWNFNQVSGYFVIKGLTLQIVLAVAWGAGFLDFFWGITITFFDSF